MKISYVETAAVVFVYDALKGCHYGLERSGSAVLRSKEINTVRFGMKEYISIYKEKIYGQGDLSMMCSYYWWQGIFSNFVVYGRFATDHVSL